MAVEQHGSPRPTLSSHRLWLYIDDIRQHPVSVVIRIHICPARVHFRYDHAARIPNRNRPLRIIGAGVLESREQAEEACPRGICASAWGTAAAWGSSVQRKHLV